MRHTRTVVLVSLVGAGIFLACEGLLALRVFEFLENRSFDLRVKLAPPLQPPPSEIVLIDIDNPSFRTLNDAIGRWPWTRLLWAELVKFLHSGGARVIVFDAIFSGKESDEVDREFAQAIAEAGNVVLAPAFAQYEAEVVPGARHPCSDRRDNDPTKTRREKAATPIRTPQTSGPVKPDRSL